MCIFGLGGYWVLTVGRDLYVSRLRQDFCNLIRDGDILHLDQIKLGPQHSLGFKQPPAKSSVRMILPEHNFAKAVAVSFTGKPRLPCHNTVIFHQQDKGEEKTAGTHQQIGCFFVTCTTHDCNGRNMVHSRCGPLHGRVGPTTMTLKRGTI